MKGYRFGMPENSLNVQREKNYLSVLEGGPFSPMVSMVPVIPVVPTIPMVAFDSDSKRFFLKDFDYCVSVGHGQSAAKRNQQIWCLERGVAALQQRFNFEDPSFLKCNFEII